MVIKAELFLTVFKMAFQTDFLSIILTICVYVRVDFKGYLPITIYLYIDGCVNMHHHISACVFILTQVSVTMSISMQRNIITPALGVYIFMNFFQSFIFSFYEISFKKCYNWKLLLFVLIFKIYINPMIWIFSKMFSQ